VKVLFDECTPRPLRNALTAVEVFTVEQAGLKGVKNGALIQAAEGHYDVLMTADKNLRCQQNLISRRIAIIELPFNSWKRLRNLVPKIQSALAVIQPGQYLEISSQ